jgi:thiol-disulfide isomerase/thioredoxin
MRHVTSLVLLAVLAAACTSQTGPTRGVVAVDQPMPTIDGESLAGDALSSAPLAGAPLVVNAWATWCGPCEAELPALVRLAERYEGRVGFLGVNYVDDAAQARRWERDYAIPYSSIADPTGRLAGDLGFPYLPHTLVVDADGTIRYRIFGETTEEEVAGLLDEVLAEPPS